MFTTIKSKLLSLLVLFISVMLLTSIYNFYNQYSSLQKNNEENLRPLVQQGISILASKHKDFLDGKLTEDEAKSQAINILRNIKFGEKNKRVLSVMDYDFYFILAPISPQMEGMNISEMGVPNLEETLMGPKTAIKNGYDAHIASVPSSETGKIIDLLFYLESFEPWKFIVSTDLNVSDINAAFWKDAQYLMVIVSILLLIMSFLVFKIINSITLPLSEISTVMTNISTGNISDAVENQGRKDEIGEMSRTVEKFRLAAVLQKSLETEKIMSSEATLQRQNKIEELIGGFEFEMESAIRDLVGDSQMMKQVAVSLTDTSNIANEQVALAASASIEASSNVTTVSVAAEELSSSINEISAQVEQTNNIVKKASEKAIQTNNQVISLSDKSQRIGAVVSLIQDIAEQTNLLALNATIEAARAGKMGKGFAVVASEVKNLANQTAKATEEISAQVNDIQLSTKDAANGIQEITQIMAEVNEYTSKISSSVDHQNNATIEITENVARASNGTLSVSNNIDSISGLIGNTNKSANQVSDVSEQMNLKVDNFQNKINDFLKNVASA